MARLIAVIVLVSAVIALPFLVWGGPWREALSVDAAAGWLRESPWAVAAAVVLHALDIFLPVPSTALTAALGLVYGPVVGTLLGTLGALGGAAMGYWTCRALGPRTAEMLAGHEGLAQARRLFARWGIGLIAGSRWVPVLPETIAFLSGMLRVPFGLFLGATALGAVPKAALFAWLGYLGRETPIAVIVLGAVFPLAVAWLTDRVARRHVGRDSATGQRPGRDAGPPV